MAGYIGSKASVVSSGAERKKTFSITGTTTSLTGLSYTVNQVHVFHNGVRLVDGTDYTATDGSTITLTNAAQAGDEVVVISYAGYQVSDTVSASQGGTFSGALDVNASSATVLTVDRASTDGTVIDVQKDGTSVGSIGVNTDRVYLATTSKGVCIDQSAARMIPTDASGNTNDANMDVGQSNGRWKDLYLSGGVYLGGTTSSNYYSDYEIGAWTPSFSSTFTEGSFNTATGFSLVDGEYIKKGHEVTCIAEFKVANTTGNLAAGDNFSITNSSLPFVPISGQGSLYDLAGYMMGYNSVGNGINASGCVIPLTSQTVMVVQITATTGSALAGSHVYQICLTYKTAL